MASRAILVCGPSPTAVGGGPTHIRNLWASPLAEQFQLELFETGSRGRESPARDEPLPATLLRLLVSPFALAWRIARLRPAVVHLNTSVDPRGFWREVSHLAVARLLGQRVLYQIHGGSLEKLMAPAWMRGVVRGVFRSPDALVVLATSEQRQFEHLGGVRRLTVIANAVDVTQFRGAGERVHSGQVRRLCYLGRLVDGKGLFEAIAAVDTLRREPGFASLELRIAGSGDAGARLQAEIDRRGLGDAVRLVGSVHGEAKVAFLRESDVFLLPSESEGLPYSVIESLASGTPVVASRVGGIPDIVHDGVHGRLVAPRDPGAIAAALRDLAASPERLQAMSRECSSWAGAELGLARLARQFGALYRDLGAIPRESAGRP
jgi:glycosyltransferase involved in cell wall biosynthesis